MRGTALLLPMWIQAVRWKNRIAKDMTREQITKAKTLAEEMIEENPKLIKKKE